MKGTIIKALCILLLAIGIISFSPHAQAGPWWWLGNTSGNTGGKAPVKTEQIALPANNGGTVSVTLPSKSTAPAKHATKITAAAAHRRAQESAADRAEDERIAADMARRY